MSNVREFKQRAVTDMDVTNGSGIQYTDKSRSGKDSSGGGGGGMDDVLRRLERVEKELADKPSKSDLENIELKIKLEMKSQTSEIKDALQQNLQNIPSEDRIKSIIEDKSKSLDLATNTYVREQVHKSNATLYKWFIGIAVAIGVVFLRQLFS